jgi:uncharacterized protein (TIGR02231 family)
MSDAKLIELPVAKVTCMEDRAQVERRGEVELPAGVHRLKVHDVSVLAVERSLRVEVNGAKLIDAKLVRRWREKPAGGLEAEASELKKKEHALQIELKACADDIGRLTIRRELVLKARAEIYREIQESTGAGKIDPEHWSRRLSEVSDQLEKIEDELRTRTLNQTWLQHRAREAGSALAASEERKSSLKCALELTIEGAGGKAVVRATYLTPCAVWRPAYRATLSADSVKLESEAIVWQRTGEPWNDVELLCSTARPTLGTTPPTLSADRISTRAKRTEEKKVVDVSMREEVIQSSGEGGVAATTQMLGLDDGGETRLLRAPAKATIPSDGQPHRVPLSSFEAKAKLERVCAPELTPLISMVAKFPNAGPHVLLAGPVDLLRQSGFVGRAKLKFAGQNETVVLSFGSEDGLRVVRNVEEKREEARITGRKTTTRTVTLFVSNASGESARVVLEERIPVSEVKEVEVQLLQKESSPGWPATASKDGIARIELDLAANSQQEAKFVWELQAASKVAGL